MKQSQEILQIIPQLIRVIRRLSTDQLDGMITIHQLRILHYVTEGMSQSQMAETMAISMAAVSKTMNCLMVKGLVDKSHGDDKRCFMLKLTAKGKRTLTTVQKEVMKELNKALTGLSAQELKDLDQGLSILNKIMLHFKEG